MKFLKIVFIIIIAFLLVASKKIKITRNKVIVRSGPSIIFPKLGELKKNDSIVIDEKVAKWIKFDYNEKYGYVSEKAIKNVQKTKNDLFKKLGEHKTDLIISKHGLSAGIKGFAENDVADNSSDESFLAYADSFVLDLEEYLKIVSSLNSKKIPNLNENKNREISPASQLLGKVLAGKIASLGIVRNDSFMQYLNAVGMSLVEKTSMYDQTFKFFVLDTDKVNAYACPNGYIFVTKGLLQILENEAELALVLAHELTHVVNLHGLEESKKRKVHIKAEQQFAELDMELEKLGIEQDEDRLKVEEELENDLVAFYNRIFEGRLMKYEYEADYFATLYAARAGYRTELIYSIINRLNYLNKESTNEHYAKRQLMERHHQLQKNGIINNINLDHKIHEKRFKNNMKLLD